MTGNHAPSPAPARSVGATPGGDETGPCSVADIDRSCRWPVLVLFTGASVWLSIGLFLGLISSIKLHAGGFLVQSPWLSFGRVYPAATNALVYGCFAPGALGLALWLLARLSRVTIFGRFAVALSGLFWNLGVALGVFGILAGESTGYEWLEMPRYAVPLLFCSYSVIGVWVLVTFHFRRERSLYVSQWYILAALFCFPWIYSTAELLLVWFPVRGTVQAVVNGWFAHNLLNLWLTPLGLAAIFYYIPKVLRRPLHSRYLAIFGFWTLVFFGSWGGVGVGVPVPKWISTLCIVAAVGMLLPLVASAFNWSLTMAGAGRTAWNHPVLRFVLFGAGSYVLASGLGILGALRSVSETTRFTLYSTGIVNLHLFGFLGMVLAAGIYDVVPRLAEREWPAPTWRGIHFWMWGGGVALVVLPYLAGGIVQGRALNDANIAFVDAIRSTVPFIGLGTLGMLVLLLASLLPLANLTRLWLACARSCACWPASPVAAGSKPKVAGANL